MKSDKITNESISNKEGSFEEEIIPGSFKNEHLLILGKKSSQGTQGLDYVQDFKIFESLLNGESSSTEARKEK